jgi:hypothetical protein
VIFHSREEAKVGAKIAASQVHAAGARVRRPRPRLSLTHAAL